MVKILLVENKLSIYIFKECNKIMKKKIAVLFLASILALSAAACTTKESTETETGSTSSVASSTESKTESKADTSTASTKSDVDVKSLLQKSYIDIVKDGKYYMELSVDTSSLTTSETSDMPKELKMVIGADSKNQKMYIDMGYPIRGFQKIVITDGKQWMLDDTSKTAYFTETSDDIKMTLDNMTSGLMGSTENINYVSDSVENFNGKECYAVVYNVKSTVSLAEGVSMSGDTSTEQTYYFDKETQKLVGMKVKMSSNETAIVVNELTATIPDNLFAIPSDYKKSDISSMMSSATAQ